MPQRLKDTKKSLRQIFVELRALVSLWPAYTSTSLSGTRQAGKTLWPSAFKNTRLVTAA